MTIAANRQARRYDAAVYCHHMFPGLAVAAQHLMRDVWPVARGKQYGKTAITAHDYAAAASLLYAGWPSAPPKRARGRGRGRS